MLLEGVVGSRAYGLDTPFSDTDYAGIFVEPTQALIGLHPPARASRSGRAGADAIYHEIGKALALMLSGNPTASELLWLDAYTATSDFGLELVALRNCFTCAPRVRRAYFGYAGAQVRELERNPHPDAARRAKQARHSVRLLWQGHQLYTTGSLPLRVPDPQWYMDFGHRVATEGAAPARSVLAEYEARFASATTPLPDAPDEEPIEDLLQRVRYAYWQRISS